MNLETIKNSKAIKNNSNRIYINTLTPYFEFQNKLGRIVMPIKRCITQ